MRISTRVAITLAAAAMAATGGGVAFAAQLSAAPAPRPPAAALSASATPATPMDPQQMYTAFQRPRSPSDAIPAGLVGSLDSVGLDKIDVNLAASRLVRDDAVAGRLWLVPGSQKSCLVDQGFGGGGFFACDLNTDLPTHPMTVDGHAWIGVAPSTISDLKAWANGTWVPVKVNSDGGFVQPADRPTQLSWIDANGSVGETPAMPGSVGMTPPTPGS